ncbi:MAG: enoyl-CoA hydratase-related protein [Gammaproteobacteria bacterium]|jgi:enoyl-CoA hydratase|nr:enoyl-CoA hydratase-related protein [Gammaproteobacteria bacterium]
MSHDNIVYEVTDHIARITFNRPRYRNAQSRRLLEELDDAFATAATDGEVRVICLFGAGDHFSAGHDLGTPDELADRKERPMQEGVRGRFSHSREQYVDKTLRWRNVPKPTIAAVQGYCIFGGWIIASAMDILFAAEDAMFLGSNFQYFSIPWDMRPRQAKEILYQSRFIDAAEAKELGLVNRVVPRERLEAETLEYAADVAKNDPFQLRMIKMAVNQMQDSQGFQGHINAAHLMHMMSAQGERDPDYALARPEGRRRPMVQRAMENYEAKKKRT